MQVQGEIRILVNRNTKPKIKKEYGCWLEREGYVK